ncbi:hypothetical protein ON010_g15358 [Phytophthora cinnamomi]|nr:hypothetical protein ON010_g15358 [Phytophthora cinnamomi]
MKADPMVLVCADAERALVHLTGLGALTKRTDRSPNRNKLSEDFHGVQDRFKVIGRPGMAGGEPRGFPHGMTRVFIETGTVDAKLMNCAVAPKVLAVNKMREVHSMSDTDGRFHASHCDDPPQCIMWLSAKGSKASRNPVDRARPASGRSQDTV